MFKKAERRKAKLRLSIAGVSGSGKTWSALEIATGMGGKIAMIDTESGRGELYGEDFNYDVLRITVPYSPEKYISAIKEAEKEGYDILIIDSLSHAWASEGGVLSMVEKAGGSFNAWGKVGTPKQNALVDAITGSNLHIIFTMRSKADYILEEGTNKHGKSVQVPKKVGMAPIQREGLEYECTVSMDMSLEHVAHVSKDNTKLFDQQYFTPTKEMGEKLMEWLNHGAEPPKDERDEKKAQIMSAKTMQELKNHYEDAVLYAKLIGDGKFKLDIAEIKDGRKQEIELLESQKSGPCEEAKEYFGEESRA